MNKDKLILNRIKCPDGTILTSHYRHDYRTHGNCMVDGGLSYLRRRGTGYEELSQYYDPDDHEHNREYFHWGTYGKEGNEERRWVLLKDLTTDHIQAIIKTQTHLPSEGESGFVKSMFIKELEFQNSSKGKKLHKEGTIK